MSAAGIIGTSFILLGLVLILISALVKIHESGAEPITRYRDCRKIQTIEVCVVHSGIEKEAK